MQLLLLEVVGSVAIVGSSVRDYFCQTCARVGNVGVEIQIFGERRIRGTRLGYAGAVQLILCCLCVDQLIGRSRGRSCGIHIDRCYIFRWHDGFVWCVFECVALVIKLAKAGFFSEDHSILGITRSI